MAVMRSLALSLLAFGYQALGDATCCVHSPERRDCWKKGIDIYSDPDFVIPQGRLREYELTVSNELINPDGYWKNATVFNGTYPGPLIEANWGDTLRVTVHNNLTNHNGTGVHWHGFRLQDRVWLDGVPGVTQCPSKPGTSQVYEFRARQYGTSWYHSHFGLQYSNGAYGPLVIHGPTSANWDVDLGPWVLADWYHEDAFSLLWREFYTTRAPIPESMVLNGKGIYDCDPRNSTHCSGDGELFDVVFEPGVKYKIGLVNTGSLLTETFWIDGHNFTVVAMDFVQIEPFVTDVINIGIGQRYEIIVEANANLDNGSNFWINAHYCDMPELMGKPHMGIVRYNSSDKSDPVTGPPAHLDFGCMDPTADELVPIVPKQVGRRVNDLEPADYLKIGLQGWPNASDPNSLIRKWALGSGPMYSDWREPSVKRLTLNSGNSSQFPPESEPMHLDYETGEWVYFVIENNHELPQADPPRVIPRSVHPIHLHGHDFYVLAQGPGKFNESIVPNLDNPPRRDVANCPIYGHLWIGFPVDNPGAWLLHCHIAWHSSAGFSIQFLEQTSKIVPLMDKTGALPELEARCAEWKDYYQNEHPDKGKQVDMRRV